MNYLISAFKPSCNILITFSDGKTRKQVPVKKENGQTAMVPLFHSQENIAGKISIEPIQGKKVEHNGVKIELLGQIGALLLQVFNMRCTLTEATFMTLPPLFANWMFLVKYMKGKHIHLNFLRLKCHMRHIMGLTVRLRYVLKVTISRGYAGSIVEYKDFVVRNYTPLPSINNSIKMEVGIEDCLHIEFEYNKSKYHLKDVIIGKIYFLLVRIKIKNMDLEIQTARINRIRG
ncbi:hypothetical protein L1049_021136 [Liquidambar formosana]|uniref:Uncharacterized protein n=1 Tax=Liquidambar formosana TaxID=63359 RepID=A0AAP0SE26_LIQFO